MSDDKSSLERAQEALRSVRYPGFPRDIVTLGLVAGIEERDGGVRVSLRLPAGRTQAPEPLERAMADALAPLGLGLEVRVVRPGGTPAPAAHAHAHPHDHGHGHGHGHDPHERGGILPDVRAVIAVSSAKGGVGKSTVATNLACAFAASGLATGLLDADVYGPSLPILMGVQERPRPAGGNRFHPILRHGVRCMSMGFFLDESSPVIWRGPMVAGLLQQFLRDCDWGALDVLVVDLPPGTGDTQLTLAQQVRVSGAVLVTTPQEVAIRDVVRGLAMFRQVQVPVLGVVENMSYLRCPSCGAEESPFGRGGGENLARAAGLPLLARIPIDPAVRAKGDRGEPIVIVAPRSESARAFFDLASEITDRVGLSAAPSAAPLA